MAGQGAAGRAAARRTLSRSTASAAFLSKPLACAAQCTALASARHRPCLRVSSGSARQCRAARAGPHALLGLQLVQHLLQLLDGELEQPARASVPQRATRGSGCCNWSPAKAITLAEAL